MSSRKFYQTALIVGTFAFCVPSISACSSSQSQVKTADHIKAGSMPAEGDWQGVYYDQLYGYLHITASGNAIQGAWETTAGDKWGELYGEADGDLLKYTWKEHTKGVVGPAATSEGKGYFRYTIPKPGEPHVIVGEWGLNENEVGHKWEALQQLNMEPDPKSVRPDELESHVGAVGFDGAKGDSNILGGSDEEKKEEDKGENKPAEGEGGDSEEAPDGI
jgi:hypothetical protein